MIRNQNLSLLEKRPHHFDYEKSENIVSVIRGFCYFFSQLSLKVIVNWGHGCTNDVLEAVVQRKEEEIETSSTALLGHNYGDFFSPVFTVCFNLVT